MIPHTGDYTDILFLVMIGILRGVHALVVSNMPLLRPHMQPIYF